MILACLECGAYQYRMVPCTCRISSFVLRTFRLQQYTYAVAVRSFVQPLYNRKFAAEFFPAVFCTWYLTYCCGEND